MDEAWQTNSGRNGFNAQKRRNMMEFENPDPIGEYIRECPYCHDVFTAQHMNREFCPEKNGLIDYCKNRYKRFARLEKQKQSNLEIEESPDIPIPPEEVKA